MENINSILEKINNMGMDEKIEAINDIRKKLHQISPFKNEPVDCVLWVKSDDVYANDYNPNSVAPPEMELLEVSIMNDWYTQPIVTFLNNWYEIIDWFHRNRVWKESKIVNKRIQWYLPIVNIRKKQEDKNDRIASTIRHNRARWKHQIDAMSEIVLELKNRNWTNSRISKELWMDEDEILRLCQISWLQDIFKDNDFSREWNSDDIQDDYEILTDEVSEEELEKYRIANVDDEKRIFHTYDKWEITNNWFFATKVEWKSHNECEQDYYNVLSNEKLFSEILERVINEYTYSCEHYLTNSAMNRIAWLWQVAVLYHTWTPSKYSSWWNLLNKEQQEKANLIALDYLNKWFKKYNMKELSLDEALSIWRQVEIY